MPTPRKYHKVTIRGVTYASPDEAAEAIGVHRKSVVRAAREGKLDELGLGPGWAHRMPVRIGGRDYASLGAAAAAIGCTPSAISKAISDGDPDRVLRARPAYNHARPITLAGVRFPSCAAASRALGFSSGYVCQVLSGRSRRMRERLLGAAMRYAEEQRRATL